MVYISYNTGTRALPDIYALALGRCAPSGIVHIYQATHSCLCYNLYIRILLYKAEKPYVCPQFFGCVDARIDVKLAGNEAPVRGRSKGPGAPPFQKFLYMLFLPYTT